MRFMIVGVDEVGRGPWAGPLVMAAVVLDSEINGLTDSKKLSKKRRDELNEIIQNEAKSIGVGWVHADELDEMGMSKALTECCLRALREINVPFHEIIIDGTVNLLKGTPLEAHVVTMKKADLLVPSVSAASIVAKVARDAFMAEQDSLLPGYDFGRHAGYGTAAHKLALDALGPCDLHRKSFAPIAAYYSNSSAITSLDNHVNTRDVTTRKIGNESETAASTHLIELGYDIIERNWKTKYCEIDIIARKDTTLFFVEVKHRRNATRGDGLAAITPKKLDQMKFAAGFYIHANKLASERALMVIATTGDTPVVEQLLKIV